MKFALQVAGLLLCSVSLTLGQTVTETVSFDNYQSPTNNDLTNRFVPGGSLQPGPITIITQTPSGGITGGALIPPNDPNYSNDLVSYCSTYQNTLGVTTTTSMCFKFNNALVNPNSYADPLDFELEELGGGENIRFGFRHSTRSGQPFFSLRIDSYTSLPEVPVANSALITGHWYKLTMQFQPVGGTFGDQVQARLELFDLGTTGTGNPVSVGFNAGALYRAPLVSASAFEVSVMGAKWGGAEVLDNFSFTGVKSSSSLCSVLAVKPSAAAPVMRVAPNPAQGQLDLQFAPSFTGRVEQVYLMNAVGKVYPVSAITTAAGASLRISRANLPAGVYVLHAKTTEGLFREKVLLD